MTLAEFSERLMYSLRHLGPLVAMDELLAFSQTKRLKLTEMGNCLVMQRGFSSDVVEIPIACDLLRTFFEVVAARCGLLPETLESLRQGWTRFQTPAVDVLVTFDVRPGRYWLSFDPCRMETLRAAAVEERNHFLQQLERYCAAYQQESSRILERFPRIWPVLFRFLDRIYGEPGFVGRLARIVEPDAVGRSPVESKEWWEELEWSLCMATEFGDEWALSRLASWTEIFHARALRPRTSTTSSVPDSEEIF